MYPYAPNVKMYRCPTAPRDIYVTCQIVDAMNGAAGRSDAKEVGLGGECIKRRMSIRRASERFVWCDEGHTGGDTWTVFYDRPSWWNLPPIRHGKGTNWGFADGHVEYYKWIKPETIELGLLVDQTVPAHVTLEQPCNKDLLWTQFHAWGEFGYNVGDCPADSLPF
jgi:prepilin-type processing-associated H-X9-DG protein